MQSTSDGYLAVMNSTELSFYNGKGGEEVRRAHGFSDPAMHAAGKYVLVVEKGGRRLRLETRAKTVAEISTDFAIQTATVSENGCVAVLTAADQNYTTNIVVYDADGNVLYNRSRAEQGVSVALSPFDVPVSQTIAGHNASLVLDIPLMLGVMAILTLPALFRGKLSRVQGVVLLALYAAFCTVQFLL
jgi:hypothetical protein